jgi:type VI secretion system protein ImpA
MPSPLTLDFDALLAPIDDDHPAGQSVRYAGPYEAIQEARREDDNLDRGDWMRATKIADWAGVIATATDTLATQSKDLQIAVWLVEALIKRHGFAGLRDGLRLLWELQERFWDSLYPEIEDGDLEFRAAPLEWMNEKLAIPIRQIPITQGLNGERYSWFDREESRVTDNLGRRNEEAMQAAIASGKLTGEQFDKAAESTPLDYYQTIFEDLTQGREAYDKLDQLLDDHYGQAAPSCMNIKQALQDCHAMVEDIVKKRGGFATKSLPSEAEGEPAGERDLAEPSQDGAEPAVAVAPPAPSVNDAVAPLAAGLTLEPKDRADALRRLAAVADFFRRTEPHSPVAYLVQRAVRWAELPLEEWLKYVIHDDTTLANVRETLGLNDQASRDSE